MERLARRAIDDKAFARYHSPTMKSTAQSTTATGTAGKSLALINGIPFCQNMLKSSDCFY
jgi:hypothetical protein